MTDIIESYQIYKKGKKIIVAGEISGNQIKSFLKADEAIQYAIDQLAATDTGGEVILAKGNYTLKKTINLKSNIRLCGSGRSTRLILGKNHQTSQGILCQNLDGVEVTNLALIAEDVKAQTAILLDDCGDSTIENIYCNGFSKYGIWVRNNSFLCEVRGCRLADCGESAIYFDNLAHGGRGGDFVPNLISNCIIYGGKKGIECNRTIVLNIVATEIFQTEDMAFLIRNTSNSVLISGCRTFQIGTDAVVVDNSHEINISSNIFCWQRGNGIVLRRVSWGSISSNNVIDSGVRHHQSYKTGIILEKETKGIQIVGNAIFNWGDQVPMNIAIKETSDCSKNIIMGNNINYCTEADIIAEGKDSLIENNASEIKTAFEAMDRNPCPDFNRDRIYKFIQAQKK